MRHRQTRERANARTRIALAVTALSVGGAIALGGCGSKGATTSATGRGPSIAVDSDRFPHALHTGSDPRIRGYQGKGLECGDCHPAEAVIKGEVSRPGKNQHAPCDDCHRDEFYEPPGALCKVCHTAVEIRAMGQSPLQPYPDRGLSKLLASEFSHAGHLDAAAMEKDVGFHVGCDDCHVRDAKRDPQLPGHAQCARCHEGEAGAKAKLPMTACTKCHPARDVELKRGRVFITGDLVFAHATHEKDSQGQPIACATCHAEIPTSDASDKVSVPTMQRCAVCHEDASKTPDRVRIARCETCHTSIASGTPPGSHMAGGASSTMAAGDLPEDHNLEFRTNHGDQASNPRANCRFCHTELNATGRDACAQCHETMRPRDHKLAWREDAHGREAQVDGDRCASCHQADYCTACHLVPPRSHQPYEEFRLGGHADAARFDNTSCMACHTAEDTCSDCHRSRR
jgi:hypothetical protein